MKHPGIFRINSKTNNYIVVPITPEQITMGQKNNTDDYWFQKLKLQTFLRQLQKEEIQKLQLIG